MPRGLGVMTWRKGSACCQILHEIVGKWCSFYDHNHTWQQASVMLDIQMGAILASLAIMPFTTTASVLVYHPVFMKGSHSIMCVSNETLWCR